MEIGPLLVALGVGAILRQIVSAALNRRKLGADTASVLTKAAAELVQPLTERIHALEAEVDGLRVKVREVSRDLETCHDRERAKDALITELTRGEP